MSYPKKVYRTNLPNNGGSCILTIPSEQEGRKMVHNRLKRAKELSLKGDIRMANHNIEVARALAEAMKDRPLLGLISDVRGSLL